MVSPGSQLTGVEQRLRDLYIELPEPPTPYGAYVEALESGRLLFLSGMLPVVNRRPRYVGRLGAEVDVESGRDALFTASLNALSTMRAHLGTLDKVARVVRLGIYLASSGEPYDQPRVADAASELFTKVFGQAPTRLVLGVASLPLGVPVELEVIAEIAP
jgi:enamine deaminase RidA (YjgF/YER057c/UK114 family)